MPENPESGKKTEAAKKTESGKKRSELRGVISRSVDAGVRQALHWQGTFDDYLDIVTENPAVARNAYQRLYDMILHFGSDTYKELREEISRYKFFSDPVSDGKDAVFLREMAFEKSIIAH